MLTELKIQNFKGWQDTGKIRMAPITLFFGANSSGKSSIGQFLMMLKQTVETPDRKVVLYPGDNHTAVRFGSYKDLIFHHDTNRKIEFEYAWQLPEPLSIRDSVSGKNYEVNGIRFRSVLGYLDPGQGGVNVEVLEYVLLEDERRSFLVNMAKSDVPSKYKVSSRGYKLIRNLGRPWSPGAPVRFYGFPDEVAAYYQNADFVQSLNLAHEKLYRSISYLGPLRQKAERLYSWTGAEPESVGYTGENAIAAILAAQDRRFNFRAGEKTKTFKEVIALKLKEMGLVDKVEIKPISEQRQDYEVKVCVRGSSDFVDLPDVGFGVSQVLPVLVQCFYAPANSIILMEQPEIHLHPAAQSALADVMIDAINSRQDGEPRNVQLVVETHSEHFLRRLQRRIAEGTKVRESDVAAYFANTANTPVTLDPLQIDRYGNISNWPDKFFGDEMEDMVEQSRAASEKRRQLRGAERESAQ